MAECGFCGVTFPHRCEKCGYSFCSNAPHSPWNHVCENEQGEYCDSCGLYHRVGRCEHG